MAVFFEEPGMSSYVFICLHMIMPSYVFIRLHVCCSVLIVLSKKVELRELTLD